MDRDTFERAQRILEERGNHTRATGFLTGKAKASPYLLSGLVSCGACGGSMHGRTTWAGKRRQDGSRIGTAYYVCGAAITKGKSVCQPIPFQQRVLDDFVLDFVGERIEALLSARGRTALRALVKKQLAPAAAPDHGPERHRLQARLDELTKKIDSVIDLAASSAEHRDLLKDRLGRLDGERQEIEGRLREIDRTPAAGRNPQIDPEGLVDEILKGLADARHLFEHGTMEERKRVVRAFVERLTVDAESGRGELRAKRIPDAFSQAIGDSFNVVAGGRNKPSPEPWSNSALAVSERSGVSGPARHPRPRLLPSLSIAKPGLPAPAPTSPPAPRKPPQGIFPAVPPWGAAAAISTGSKPD